jgi:uncharacterized sodium:solute symporter family permease YidK
MLIMIGVSKFYPGQSRFTIVDVGAVALVPWKYTKTMSVVLIVITLIIYVLLGSVA